MNCEWRVAYKYTICRDTVLFILKKYFHLCFSHRYIFKVYDVAGYLTVNTFMCI
jgi:hypothetical protein